MDSKVRVPDEPEAQSVPLLMVSSVSLSLFCLFWLIGISNNIAAILTHMTIQQQGPGVQFWLTDSGKVEVCSRCVQQQQQKTAGLCTSGTDRQTAKHFHNNTHLIV